MEIKIIDKYKILETAKEAAAQGDFFAKNSDIAKELNCAELLMLMGFTNIEILSKSNRLPNKIRNAMFRNFNDECQTFAFEMKRNREYFSRQTELIPITEDKRAELTHLLEQGEYFNALETACRIIDICCFGVAESHIYENLLHRALKQTETEKQYA